LLKAGRADESASYFWLHVVDYRKSKRFAIKNKEDGDAVSGDGLQEAAAP
jgi:hypothetical protein